MKLPRRIRIIPAYLAIKLKNNVAEGQASLSEVLKFLIQPSGTERGKKHIESVKEVDGYQEVLIRGLKRPLYYPDGHSFSILAQTVDEGMDPNHGHYFLIPETDISEGDVVIDCGAAEGFFALKAVERGCDVFAFEPLPTFADALRKTFEGEDLFKLRKVAVGRRAETVYFEENETASKVSGAGSIEIQLCSIDDELFESLERCDLLKADIEGFEYDMLLGAEKIIKKHRPKIAVTVYHEENSSAEIERFLSSCHSDYKFRRKGLALNGQAIVLHAW